MAPDDLEFADRLDRLLDGLIAGRARSPNGTPPDHELAETVRWLHDRDDAMPADPRFADRLLEDLMHTANEVIAPPFHRSLVATTGGNDPLAIRSTRRREDARSRWAPAQLATAALLVFTLAASFVAFGPGRPGRADDVPAMVPAMSGTPSDQVEGGQAVETLVTTILPVENLPTTATAAVLLWYATIDLGTEVAIPPEPISCCPGPQISHVLGGELSLRVEGPLRVLRAADDGTMAPEEEVTPGTEVVLRAGDTAVYGFELAATYRNSGSERVQLVAGGAFAGSPPGPPAPYAIVTFKEQYPAPKLPPGPLTATLQRVQLAPKGIFPAPPSGALQVVMTGPEEGTLGDRSDGSTQNLGQEPVEVFALTLRPEAPEGSTPAAS